MPAIGYLNLREDGSYEGNLQTMAVRAKIVMLPIANPSPKGSQFRVFTSGRIEIGAAWNKTSNEGKGYISVKLQDPSFNTLYANLGPAAGQDDPNVLAIIWNPRD